MRVPFTEKEYDVFDISSNVNYTIVNGDVQIINESSVQDFVSGFADSLFHIEKALIGTVLLQLEKEKNDLHQTLREDFLECSKNECSHS